MPKGKKPKLKKMSVAQAAGEEELTLTLPPIVGYHDGLFKETNILNCREMLLYLSWDDERFQGIIREAESIKVKGLCLYSVYMLTPDKKLNFFLWHLKVIK